VVGWWGRGKAVFVTSSWRGEGNVIRYDERTSRPNYIHRYVRPRPVTHTEITPRELVTRYRRALMSHKMVRNLLVALVNAGRRPPWFLPESAPKKDVPL
jgi:hypothetical protein